MRDAGLQPRTLVADFTSESGRIATAEVLRRWPDVDAILAVCDATALGVMTELRARHIDVPGDIAVAGFDDIPFAQFSQLTTATHPVEAIAEAATRAVLEASPSRPTSRSRQNSCCAKPPETTLAEALVGNQPRVGVAVAHQDVAPEVLAVGDRSPDASR